MPNKYCSSLLPVILLLAGISATAQNSIKPKYTNSIVYTGIEVGSKGVKMSVIEIGKNAQSTGAFNVLKDTSVNTDFISFTDATFQATLNGLIGLYGTAEDVYKIPAKRIFTVISSGVKMQAEKDAKLAWINNLIDSFRLKIKEPNRKVEVVDVMQEGKLSHLGIVPDSRRYSTFLIDIGSGNTKGGFFPYGNTKDFKLFQINWGTKSTTNATDKNCVDDKSLENYNKQLYRVLAGAEHTDIIYAVNSSGAFPVTFAELARFNDQLYNNFNALSAKFLSGKITTQTEREAAFNEITRVHAVFDQKALMAGTGLLLKIMRQFESAFASKQFYLVKNGQVGWVSAYVDQQIDK